MGQVQAHGAVGDALHREAKPVGGGAQLAVIDVEVHVIDFAPRREAAIGNGAQAAIVVVGVEGDAVGDHGDVLGDEDAFLQEGLVGGNELTDLGIDDVLTLLGVGVATGQRGDQQERSNSTRSHHPTSLPFVGFRQDGEASGGELKRFCIDERTIPPTVVLSSGRRENLLFRAAGKNSVDGVARRRPHHAHPATRRPRP